MSKPRRARPGSRRIAVALLRVSTSEQNVDAQRRAIEAWASREGITVAAWRIEQGVSGGAQLDERTELLAAIEDVRRFGAGFLVVSKRDRLARDVMLSAMIERLAERNGARVMTTDGTSNEASPEGTLMRGMVDLFAQYERLLIGSRTKAALSAKRARGERTGEIPFGFQCTDGRNITPCALEQATIEQVHALREGRTIRAVAAECTRLGLVSRTGRALSATQVHRILSVQRVDQAAE